MHKYVIKRVLFLIPTILGVILIIYAIMSITPGTPGQAVLGSAASQQDIDAYNEMIGYNRPFLQKYVDYVIDMLHGDFGTSYFTKQSVFDEVMPRYMLTIRLAVMGVLLSTLIGVPIGIYAAVRQYSLWDTIPSVISFLLAAVPTFVLGMLLLYEFALKLNILPSYGVSEGIKSYIMPALAMAIPPAAQNIRFTKSSMLESIRQDYVRTARAKGAPERTVIWKHALKNALLPVVTQIGLSLGMFICGAVVVERMFSLPGIGSLIVDRISYKDEPIIIAGTILISIVFTVVMLLIDVIYAFIDPRIRAKYAGTKGK